MKKINKIKIIIICFITIFTPFYTCILNFKYFDNNNEENEYSIEKPKNSDYSSFSEGIGENINISLQQSLLDNSVIEISNVSDSDNNLFYEPCPTVQNFNSSSVNITIEDIYAPNKTLIIEDYPVNAGRYDFTNSEPGATSFKINGNGYLENISVMLSNFDNVDTDTVGFYVYNSTWNSTTQKSVPDGRSPRLDTYIIPVGFIIGWYTITNQHYYLDNSKTENNTWFIGLYDMGLGDGGWTYIDDNSDYFGASDDNNETWSYYKSGMNWILLDSSSGCPSVDLKLKIGLSPFISYPNEELIVEDDEKDWHIDLSGLYPVCTSFKISSDRFLDNISIYCYKTLISTGNITVFLYNSTWNHSRNINVPGGNHQGIVLGILRIPPNSEGWYSLTDVHYYLNNSKTNNNTWFIGLIEEVSTYAWWHYVEDHAPNGDGIDETISIEYTENETWELLKDLDTGEWTIDLMLKVGLVSHNNIPIPKDIGLMINNTAVIGYKNVHGMGYWNSTQTYSSSSGQLEFEITADWWDVSCKISHVQITYIKTDLKANSMFRILGSGQNVSWNASRIGGLNLFDPRLSNYRINLTIPSAWDNIDVFNGPTNKTDDLLISSNKNGYKVIQVFNAGNGTYWYLTAISENLLTSIDTYVDSISTEIVRYSDIVDFYATFKEIIAQNDGIINLRVYNPSTIDNELIFSSSNSTFSLDIEFDLGGWDISDNVTNNGEFRIQIFWNNNTAAGFSEKILTVMGETELILITPNQDTKYYSNQTFNIVVFYKDLNQLSAIDGASVQYNINGQGWQSSSSNNGTVGYYLIPVDCSIFTIDGTKTVEIITSKNYYENQTLNYNFNVIIVEENNQAEDFPLAYIIITIISTMGGIGVITIIFRLRKRKRANTDI